MAAHRLLMWKSFMVMKNVQKRNKSSILKKELSFYGYASIPDGKIVYFDEQSTQIAWNPTTRTARPLNVSNFNIKIYFQKYKSNMSLRF